MVNSDMQELLTEMRWCVEQGFMGPRSTNAMRKALAELERASQPGSGEAEDAARYRWLRNRPVGKGVPLIADGIQFIFAVRDARQSWVVHSVRGEEMDTAIDAARASLDGRREG
jgi:hypothetical protein